jgi:hypothetical protein
MTEKPQNQSQSQPPNQPSPPPNPKNNLPKVDPSMTINYRRDGVAQSKAKK